MDRERWYGIVDHKLGQALSSFKGIMSEQEAADDVRRMCENGYSHTVKHDVETIRSFLASSPDLEWVRDFVEWEMNYNLEDSTGVRHLEWVRSALETMEDVLKDYELKSAVP